VIRSKWLGKAVPAGLPCGGEVVNAEAGARVCRRGIEETSDHMRARFSQHARPGGSANLVGNDPTGQLGFALCVDWVGAVVFAIWFRRCSVKDVVLRIVSRAGSRRNSQGFRLKAYSVLQSLRALQVAWSCFLG